MFDKIFQKQTQNCQCDLSPESSEISCDQSASEHSFPPSLTDTDVSDFSDQESTYSEEDLIINHLYNEMNT